MKTVIMAGGRGTRLSSVARDIPKPMVMVGDKPVLEHTILCLKKYGFIDIIITVGYLAEVIIDYFGDGSRFGVNIDYYVEKQPLGNAGALLNIREKLNGDFLLLNADVLFDVDLKRFYEYHMSKQSLASIVVHPNSHPYDSGIVIIDQDNRVCTWLAKEDKHPMWYKNLVNAGIHILSPLVLDLIDKNGKIDLDRDILKPLAGTGQLLVYRTPEYIKDLGTPERYKNVCEDYLDGKVLRKNLSRKQKAIFLDRDGTINKYVGFLRNIDDFELIQGVAQAIKKINLSGYLVIVITNQPVIARGELCEDELNEIHNKMETLLGQEGAYIDDLYYCPHHPDSGFVGEVKALKMICECRKPKPGLIFKAASDYNIELSASWMIGDSDNDVLSGINAGCKALKLSDNISLLNAINMILGE